MTQNNVNNAMGNNQGGGMQNTNNTVNTMYGTGGDARQFDMPNDMISDSQERL